MLLSICCSFIINFYLPCAETISLRDNRSRDSLFRLTDFALSVLSSSTADCLRIICCRLIGNGLFKLIWLLIVEVFAEWAAELMVEPSRTVSAWRTEWTCCHYKPTVLFLSFISIPTTTCTLRGGPQARVAGLFGRSGGELGLLLQAILEQRVIYGRREKL